MERKDFTELGNQIKGFHEQVVAEIKALMVAHNVDEVDLLGSNCQHAQVMGYDEDDIISMEVSKVYLEDDKIVLDVILDIDTEELAEQNENGDIGDAYQVYDATDYSHIIPMNGIVSVYDAVYEVLEYDW